MPKSNGHYSTCIEHNGLLYVSGQLPIDTNTGVIPKSVEEQTDLVLQKLLVIVNEAGSSLENIIQVRIYLSDIELWSRVNERYASFFKKHKPVRCVVPTKKLHYNCLIEMEIIAVTNSK